MGKVRAQHILVDHEYEAQDLERKLAEGSSFEDLASSHSKCPSAKKGGDLGFFGPGQMVDSFEEAAFALNMGEISAPVRTRFGYHLIKRIG